MLRYQKHKINQETKLFNAYILKTEVISVGIPVTIPDVELSDLVCV